jgi:hypothetical protein
MSNKKRGPIPQGITGTVMPISPGDLAVIAEIMGSYLAFIRFSYRASAQREAYARYVEDLCRRLAGQVWDDTPVPLTLEDMQTIETAMKTFEVMTAQIVPQTKERDATIAACASLRHHIARMRSGSPSRRSLN